MEKINNTNPGFQRFNSLTGQGLEAGRHQILRPDGVLPGGDPRLLFPVPPHTGLLREVF